MESVGKTPQCVERDLGEVLAARNAAIANSEDVPGVGPPDLCWVQRTAKGLFRKKNPKKQGYYHWVVGLNVTSPAAIAAYFARLTSSVKKVGYYQGMGVAREFQIERGIYCCYDPFTEMDIWLDIALPGGLVSRSLDRQGYLHDVSPEIWQGAQVGCFLRSQIYNISVTSHCSRSFQHLAPFTNQVEETEMLNAVFELYQRAAVQPMMQNLHWDRGQGLEPHHLDIVCSTLLDYFKTRKRWQKALQFFTHLQSVYPSSVVYTAYVYQELDNPEGAAEVLKSSLEKIKKEDNPMVVLACGQIELQKKNFKASSKIARSVLATDVENRPAWLLLSQSYLCQGDYTRALRTLHLSPAPLIPSDRKTLLFRVLPSKPRFVTKSFSYFHPEETELSAMNNESQKIGKMMNIVPGQILSPRFHLHGFDWGLYSCTQSVMRAAYDIVLDIVQLIGWEKFCHLRSSVFIIPDEEETEKVETKVESKLVLVEWIIEERKENPVCLILHSLETSVLHEKPKRRTEAVYVRSISVPEDRRPERSLSISSEKPKKEVDVENTNQIASDVLSRGLGQITKKTLQLPKISSTSTTIITPEDEEEQQSLVESYSGVSMESRTGGSRTETEPLASPAALDGGQSNELGNSVVRKKRLEVVTSSVFEAFPDDADVVPDAPENALPKQCPPYSIPGKSGPPSSTGVSQDKWQVKIVSMGIKDRVKYFEKVSKEKIERQGRWQPSGKLEDVLVSSMMPRRGRYKISQTIMEVLIKDDPEQSSSSDVLLKEEEGDGEQESSGESPDPMEAPPEKQGSTDWGTFALQDASFLPQTRQSSGDRLDSGQWSSSLNLSFRKGSVEESLNTEKPQDCAPWLDELILALWEDLAIFGKFKDLDKKLKARNMQTHAEQILGTIEWNTDTTEEDDKTPKYSIVVPDSRPIDWLRRGLLCQRLRKFADAEQAFRVCSFLSFSLTSLLALSQIYSDLGYCKGAIMMLNRLAHFHHKKRDSRKEPYLPTSCVKYLSMLIESVGIKDVKAAAESCHPLLNQALEDVLVWRMQ